MLGFFSCLKANDLSKLNIKVNVSTNDCLISRNNVDENLLIDGPSPNDLSKQKGKCLPYRVNTFPQT